MIAALKALGKKPLPAEIEVAGRRYQQRRIFKNDFFAATAYYEGDDGKVVLKVQRQASFFGFPLSWVGRILSAKEVAALTRLDGVPGVPRLIGRWGKTGLIREYVDGCTLADAQKIGDEFHPRLRTLIEELHRRGMAFVDLEKRENVLVGEDGNPYLFDFQISWYLPARWGGELWPARFVRRWLQSGDRYHLLKLQRRTRRDQMTPEQLAASYHKPWFVRVYTRLTRPLTWIRRRILNRLEPDRPRGERGRVATVETVGASQQCR